jgi:hypothetical protein
MNIIIVQPSIQVANAVAALTEIAETSGKSVMNVTAGVLQKLLAALNECTEWVSVCSENILKFLNEKKLNLTYHFIDKSNRKIHVKSTLKYI